MNNRRPLGPGTTEVMKHIRQLWGYEVELHSVDTDGEIVIQLFSCISDYFEKG